MSYSSSQFQNLPLNVFIRGLLSSKYTYIVIILITSIAVYLNTLPNDFVYDDEFQVLQNPWIKDVRYIPEIFSSDVWAFRGEGVSNYYRPLLHIVFMINYNIFGLKPWGFHLTNIIFHAGVSILIFLIASILINHPARREKRLPPPLMEGSETSLMDVSRGGEYSLLLPLIAALLFATHPIHTEAVAWVSGIPELSFTFFYVLSFYLYMRTNGESGRGFVLSILFFFMATLCKETALTLPILLFAYDFSFSSPLPLPFTPSPFTGEGRGGGRVRGIFGFKRYLPYLIVAGIYFILRTYAIGGFAPLKRHAELSNYEYFINVFPLFIQYFEKLIFPINLNVFYVFHPISSLFEWKGIITFILTLIFISLVYLFRNLNRIVFFSLLWIVIPLLPVLYIPALGENTFAERYLYLPSVGFVFIIFAIMKNFYQLKSFKSATMPTIILTLFIVAGLYAVGAIKRNTIWENNHLLWEDAVAKSPDAAQSHNNLGKAFYDKGLIDAAMAHYQIALKLKPDYPEAHNNLGITYYVRGLYDKAIEHFQYALRLNSDFAADHSNLGVVYQTSGQIDKAIEHYQTALKLRPNNPIAHNNLGRAYYEKGLMDKAIQHYKIALKLRPDFPEAMDNLRKSLKKSGLGK